jgi:hypothetical protein
MKDNTPIIGPYKTLAKQIILLLKVVKKVKPRETSEKGTFSK